MTGDNTAWDELDRLISTAVGQASFVVDGQPFELGASDGVHRAEWLLANEVDQAALTGVLRRVKASRIMVMNSAIDSLAVLAEQPTLSELGIVQTVVKGGLGFIRQMPALRVLLLFDVRPRVDLADVARGERLEGLSIRGGFSSPLSVETLAPLTGLAALRELELLNVRTPRGDVRQLESLKSLGRLILSDQHDFEDFAYLSTRLPHVQPSDLSAYWITNEAAGTVMIRGRRKPELSIHSDAERIERYVREFNRLRSEYSED